MTLPRVPRVPRFRLAAVLLALALPASAAPPAAAAPSLVTRHSSLVTPAAALPQPVLLASLAADGTAVFWGAETNGAYCPPTFAAAVRFRPGEAAATALSNAVRLVVDSAPGIPAGAFAGLPALRSVVLSSRTRSVGPRAFADCKNLVGIFLPGNVTFQKDTFAGSKQLVIYAPAGGTTQKLAHQYGIPFVNWQ